MIEAKWSRQNDRGKMIEAKWSRQNDRGKMIEAKWSRQNDRGKMIEAKWSRQDRGKMIEAKWSREGKLIEAKWLRQNDRGKMIEAKWSRQNVWGNRKKVEFQRLRFKGEIAFCPKWRRNRKQNYYIIRERNKLLSPGVFCSSYFHEYLPSSTKKSRFLAVQFPF